MKRNYQKHLLDELNHEALQSTTLADEHVTISEKLYTHICDNIQRNNNYLSFSSFMQQVLYTPRLGYYQNSKIKIGERGDFMTAPEFSPLFSIALAQQFIDDNADHILEIGAGSGKNACEILRFFRQNHYSIEAYYILEPSAFLQSLQKQYLQKHLPEMFNKVQWLNALPQQFTGICFANEVLDALPVERFQWQKSQKRLIEQGVCIKEDRLQWCLRPDHLPQPQWITNASEQTKVLQQHWCDGYQSEYHLMHIHWIKSLEQMLTHGYLYLIDYGLNQKNYYRSDRSTGLLQCYYQHQSHQNPLILLGLQDITTHINLCQVKELYETLPFKQYSQINQGDFLVEKNVLRHALIKSDSKQHIEQKQWLKKIIMPYEMGDTIQIICLEK